MVIDKEQGGRPSGEAFVRLASKEHAELALERSKNNMGSRYGFSQGLISFANSFISDWY